MQFILVLLIHPSIVLPEVHVHCILVHFDEGAANPNKFCSYLGLWRYVTAYNFSSSSTNVVKPCGKLFYLCYIKKRTGIASAFVDGCAFVLISSSASK